MIWPPVSSERVTTKIVFTLELVWPTSQVEPGSMCWYEQKNNQKTQPGSKILTLEIAGFNPGLTRVWPALSVVWIEISDYDPGYRLPEVGNLTAQC